MMDISDIKPIRARRTHQKSRLGCANCKKRRIKVRVYFATSLPVESLLRITLCFPTFLNYYILVFTLYTCYHYAGNTAPFILFPSTTIYRATGNWLVPVRRKKTGLLQLFKPLDWVRISHYCRDPQIAIPQTSRNSHWAAMSKTTPTSSLCNRRTQTDFQTIQNSAIAIYPVDWNTM